MDQGDVAAVVHRAAGGEEAAWHQLVESFSSLVWSVALRQGLSRPDAGEAVQMTFLRLVENLGRLREPEALGGWLATTARREAWRVSRRVAKEVPTESTADLDAGAVDPGPEERALVGERARVVRQAFGRLPERCARLLELVVILALPYTQVARMLEMPIGSIGPTRARCLQRLRALLADEVDRDE
ncbi:sigma-70 family RNA polymerase sigma factor [Pseudonocardia yuanmonensis]|uniref:Sigma-70 family RNA polymerase sigma factor n=1 Tax=Pseudonocardia yuanmonensis TaxID=1095914 RepID=A0ABP8XAC8_9PSEU